MRKNKSRSVIASLDPRTKLLLTALFTIIIFIINTLPAAAAVMCGCICLCLAAGIPLKKVFPHARLLAGLIVLIMILQIIFGTGPYTGLMIACRVIALAALMPVLTMTTGAKQLARGITRLGVPYRTALVITSTLNLIPAFEEEARHIMDARRLRGMQSVRLKEYPAIALPLIIKAMRKAQMAGLAMDARAFGAYKTRTWFEETGIPLIKQ